ncbi:MAG: lytic murein transglycosylase [Micavibrio sp.]|nr:lytic murein transglycosylase [Micavibrio sp.]
MSMTKLCLLFAFLTVCIPSAQAASFESWLSDFKVKAQSRGISKSTLLSAFQDVSPHQRVIDLDGKQPERKKIGFETYLRNVMSQNRIDQGRINFQKNKYLLYKVEQQYGVPAQVIVSLWGIETSYGKNTGGFDLIQSLATLAWEGRRRDFFEKELLAALEILQGGHVQRQDFKGSWAGAMGQNQFMPTSWKRYAIDANGDGHKDIWSTQEDIFSSSANYLKENGWNQNYPWGWQVSVPSNIQLSLASAKVKKPLMEWVRMGVHFSSGQIPNGQAQTSVRLVVPDGGNGRAYLVTSNFETILSWNRSDYFALTVGLLSDFIASQPTGTALHLNP